MAGLTRSRQSQPYGSEKINNSINEYLSKLRIIKAQNDTPDIFEEFRKLNNLEDEKPMESRSVVHMPSYSDERSCEICSFMFPLGSTTIEIEQHRSKHFGPTCPICYLKFRKDYPQREYEVHVQNHFSS